MGAAVTRLARLLALAACLVVPTIAASRADGSKVVSTSAEHVALQGYDTVAYFTDGKAVKGDPRFVAEIDDARWYFASAAHRDLFAADPDRYMPQYGGYCAGAMAHGELVVANPEIWAMVDGKLYIYSGLLAPGQQGSASASVSTDEIRRADAEWPAARQRALALRQQAKLESESGIAGYDAVAYFTDGRALRGSEEFAAPFENLQWYFVSASHRDLFLADPKRYEPQYRGLSAIDLAAGRDIPGDPEAWTIIDGRLYLNHSILARNQMAQDSAAIIGRADAVWASRAQAQ